MAACDDEIGGKGAPRWSHAYSCDRKRSVELLLLFFFLKYTFKLHTIKDKVFLHKKSLMME